MLHTGGEHDGSYTVVLKHAFVKATQVGCPWYCRRRALALVKTCHSPTLSCSRTCEQFLLIPLSDAGSKKGSSGACCFLRGKVQEKKKGSSPPQTSSGGGKRKEEIVRLPNVLCFMILAAKSCVLLGFQPFVLMWVFLAFFSLAFLS